MKSPAAQASADELQDGRKTIPQEDTAILIFSTLSGYGCLKISAEGRSRTDTGVTPDDFESLSYLISDF